MSRFVQQTNWARGEIEPTLEGRQEAEFYQASAELLDNWLPDTVSSISVRAPFETIAKLPRTLVHDPGDGDLALSILEDQQNLLGYVYRGVQVLIHLAVYEDTLGFRYLVARAYRTQITKLDTDSPARISSVVQPGQRYISNPLSAIPANAVYEVGFAVAGPAAFITHRLFPPLRVIPTSQDPTIGAFNIEEIEWFQELFGFATPEPGTSNWKGNEDAIFDEQLSVGDVIRFRNQLYTIAGTSVETDVESDDFGIHSFTTQETYTGITLTDRVDLATEDAFEGNPSLVAFYQGRLVLAATASRPTGVWLSRSADPFTIVPSSVDDASPINQELLAEGADEFVWMTGGDRLYFGSGLGEYALGSPDEMLTPTQLRFFRIGNNGGAPVTPIVVDGSVIFVNRGRNQVLSVVFDFARQSFNTTNLSLLASHLTEDVVDLAYRPPVRNDRTPRIFALADGQVRAFALSESASLAAWNRISHSPAFEVVSVAGTSEYLFAVCNRGNDLIDLAVLRNE